jgi:hypothetical protein
MTRANALWHSTTTAKRNDDKSNDYHPKYHFRISFMSSMERLQNSSTHSPIFSPAFSVVDQHFCARLNVSDHIEFIVLKFRVRPIAMIQESKGISSANSNL